MKKYLFVVTTALVFLVGSCDITPENGNINVKVVVTAKDTPIVLNTGVYNYGAQRVRFKFETIRFYFSNIRLKDSEGGEILLGSDDNVKLIRWGEEEITAFKISVPPGEFSGFTIGCGLTPEINSVNPDDYEPGHPLANDRNMYWGMASKYIFLKVEGFADTTGTLSGPFDCPIVYHIGLDENYYEAKFDASQFSVVEKGETDLTLKFDIWKLWKGEYDINVRETPLNMTLDDPETAHKLMDNFADGWVIIE